MSRKKQTPAEVVIAEFGIRPLAREIPVDPSTIIRWRERGDGLIPSRYHRRLLALAKAHGRTLTAADLVSGRPPQ
jgi:hypothetical protein